jgi:hypothetical protein
MDEVHQNCAMVWKHGLVFMHIEYGNYHNPSFGLATKAKGLQGCGPRERKPRSQGKGIARVRAKRKPGSHITYSRECKKCEGVWGSEHSHSQGNSHFGRWSPGGLPKFQRAIAGVKTQWLATFFISLESSWNVDVWNGLALLIWTSETQVMAKRRAGSQITSLTPDHKKSRIDSIYLASGGMPHIVGKLLMRATTLL